jgi:amidase
VPERHLKPVYASQSSEIDLARREVSHALRSRKISAAELLEHTIPDIEALDQRLNAIVVRDFDRAKDSAKTADAAPTRSELPRLGPPMMARTGSSTIRPSTSGAMVTT